MNPYLPHLLADVKAAHNDDLEEPKEESQSLEEHFAEIDRFVSGDAERTLGYFCGLKSADFPPPEQFNEKEINKVCSAFKSMLGTWGVDINLPDNLPFNMRYELMVALINRGFTPLKFRFFVFDFCTGYAPDCELGSYCPCLEVWNDEV